MRLISYQHNEVPGVGVMTDDDNFVELNKAAPALPTTLRGIIETGPDWQAQVEAAIDGRPADKKLTNVTLDPVIPVPHATWALALNYQAHKDETGLERGEFPEIFLRMPIGQVGHNHPLIKPRESVAKVFDFEGELAVIIGKPGRYIAEANALDYVAGYSVYNEGSVRDFQRHNRQFGLGKSFEASGSFGPWMMTPDEFGDPYKQRVITRLNGEPKQDAGIDEMLNSIENTIAYLSQGYTIQPGDVVVSGTPGSLPGTDKHMQVGDVCEVEVTGLGILSNTIVAAD